jgi:hypothetical protein
MPSFNPATLTVQGKRKSFAVPGVSSLYLRVSETGTKTWMLKYKVGTVQTEPLRLLRRLFSVSQAAILAGSSLVAS